MRLSIVRHACLVSFAALLAAGCKKKEDNASPTPTPTNPPAQQAGETPGFDRALLAAFKPLPKVMEAEGRELGEAKISLGRMLYFDKRLSKNHDVACNSCPMLDPYGVDGQPTSEGHRKQRGGRNSPTVYNAAAHIAQFWDGRAADVEEQAKGPVLNPIEMAMPDEASVVAVLSSIPGYVEAFAKAYPDAKDAVTYDNMAIAIGAFERKLVTPGRWDSFLGGDDKALSDAEKKGLVTFVQTGCTACHSGAYLGGQTYQKVGVVKPWPNTKDVGRFDVTKKDEDKMLFKVPALRNIANTGPYFHDGSVAKLDKAIQMMAEHQIGKTLTDDQTASIATFLAALTGELPTDYIAKPELPESGPKTPKPDPT